MTLTIRFNTGRAYTREGQIITATLHSDGIVTFMDHSRMIDGEFSLPPSEVFSRKAVLSRYDAGLWQGSIRSSHDGMLRGGCNTRDASAKEV